MTGARSRLGSAVCAACLAAAFATLPASTALAQPQAYADPAKVLRIMMPVAETGFDPAAVSDLYSSHVNRAIFETLYGLDYLARPYRQVPVTAAAMPEISADGRVWIMRVKPGIRFADDPVFQGRPRELTAHDYVYSWKRLLDPRVRSPYQWYLAGKLVGADPVLERAKAAGRLDYDAQIPGLRALDRHTIRMELKDPDYVMLGYLSHIAMAAVAREVVEAWGDASGWVMANPVGTGPYRLKDWRRGQKIVLEANPGFREEFFPAAPADADARTRETAAPMAGMRLPRIGRVEISVIEESSPQLLAFSSGDLDYLNVPPDLVANVLDPGGRPKPELAAKGVTLHRVVQPSLAYTYFNMDDPVVGGYAPEKVALRRAISLGFNTPDLIRVWWQDQALPATQPIPPGVSGHDPSLDVGTPYDPATARALLDRFGYRDRDGDGWRERPDGSPLLLEMSTEPSQLSRALQDVWRSSLTTVGVRIAFRTATWQENIKASRAGKLQMWGTGWSGALPDGGYFLDVLYGPNKGQSNHARFDLPAFNALYERQRKLPDGPERDALIQQALKLSVAYMPIKATGHVIGMWVSHPRVHGFVPHPFIREYWRFLDVDPALPAH